MLILIAVTLSRASFRLVGEFMRRQRQSGPRVVVYGAGEGGTLALREVLARDGGDMRMVGFIDDDPRKAEIRVQGFPVLGGYSALTVLLKAASVDTVVVSTRRMAPERLNNLQVLCEEAGVQLSRLLIAIQPILDPEEAQHDPRPALHQVKEANSRPSARGASARSFPGAASRNVGPQVMIGDALRVHSPSTHSGAQPLAGDMAGPEMACRMLCLLMSHWHTAAFTATSAGSVRLASYGLPHATLA